MESMAQVNGSGPVREMLVAKLDTPEFESCLALARLYILQITSCKDENFGFTCSSNNRKHNVFFYNSILMSNMGEEVLIISFIFYTAIMVPLENVAMDASDDELIELLSCHRPVTCTCKKY